MICLMAISGTSSSGCFWPLGVPPAASMRPLPGQYGPGMVRSIPAPLLPSYRPQPPLASGNPWKPGVPEREWNHIVIHHTASSGGSVESIHEAHLKRKDKNGDSWLGIGYHFVIGNGSGMSDGAIEPTFRWKQQMHGAHAGVTQYNQHGIGIVLVGNFEEAPPSSAQMVAVKQLVGTLKSAYQIAGDQVVGHGDVKATACPGKYFPLAEVSQSFVVPAYSSHTPNQPAVRLASVKGSQQQ